MDQGRVEMNAERREYLRKAEETLRCLRAMRSQRSRWAWRCQECGYTFRSAAAAERATYSERGCPGCGGSDIDCSLPVAA